MIAAFVGHGAPHLAVDPVKGSDYARWGANMVALHGTPRAIVMVSAHWRSPHITLGCTGRPSTIHDFRRCPAELYELQYPAPGAPDVAAEVVSLMQGEVHRDEERGFDHGVWAPLWHMFPDANVPVLQISLLPGAQENFRLGERLSVLRNSDVLVMGSGSITHNLAEVTEDGTSPPTWAVEFDAWCAEVIRDRDWDRLMHYEQVAPHALRAHPTAEHVLPLIFAAGAGSTSRTIDFPVQGFEFGSLSRRSVEFSG